MKVLKMKAFVTLTVLLSLAATSSIHARSLTAGSTSLSGSVSVSAQPVNPQPVPAIFGLTGPKPSVTFQEGLQGNPSAFYKAQLGGIGVLPVPVPVTDPSQCAGSAQCIGSESLGNSQSGGSRHDGPIIVGPGAFEGKPFEGEVQEKNVKTKSIGFTTLE